MQKVALSCCVGALKLLYISRNFKLHYLFILLHLFLTEWWASPWAGLWAELWEVLGECNQRFFVVTLFALDRGDFTLSEFCNSFKPARFIIRLTLIKRLSTKILVKQ